MTVSRWRVALINPNTDPAVTARMVAMAERFAGTGLEIVGLTAPFGAPLLTSEADLATAELAVCSLASQVTNGYDSVIVSAFGDPGLQILLATLSIPVVGIGEAAMRRAAIVGNLFCVATTTPNLAAAIDRKVEAMGLSSRYAGVVLTEGDVIAVTNDPSRLEQGLSDAIQRAVANWAIDVVIIGGGPLTNAAHCLADRLAIRIVNPVEAAVDELLARLGAVQPAEWIHTSV